MKFFGKKQGLSPAEPLMVTAFRCHPPPPPPPAPLGAGAISQQQGRCGSSSPRVHILNRLQATLLSCHT